jgi:hypothetical protein
MKQGDKQSALKRLNELKPLKAQLQELEAAYP